MDRSLVAHLSGQDLRYQRPAGARGQRIHAGAANPRQHAGRAGPGVEVSAGTIQRRRAKNGSESFESRRVRRLPPLLHERSRHFPDRRKRLRDMIVPGEIFLIGDGPQQTQPAGAEAQPCRCKTKRPAARIQRKSVERDQLQVGKAHPRGFPSRDRPDQAVKHRYQGQRRSPIRSTASCPSRSSRPATGTFRARTPNPIRITAPSIAEATSAMRRRRHRLVAEHLSIHIRLELCALLSGAPGMKSSVPCASRPIAGGAVALRTCECAAGAGAVRSDRRFLGGARLVRPHRLPHAAGRKESHSAMACPAVRSAKMSVNRVGCSGAFAFAGANSSVSSFIITACASAFAPE